MFSDNQINDAIWTACVANDAAALAAKISYRWSKKDTTLYGIANYSKKRIYLSRPYFDTHSIEYQYACVAHLVCHMVVRYRWLRRKAYQAMPSLHGLEWRHAMNMARAPWRNQSCDTPPSEALIKKAFMCECHSDLKFNLELAKKLASSHFFCEHCSGILQPMEDLNAAHKGNTRINS